MARCNATCQIFSRVVGYFRPITTWNRGKKMEFADRLMFTVDKALLKSKEEKGK